MTIPDPACMEPDELALWHDANSSLLAHAATTDPCADCLVPYALRMMAEGRCNGVPGMARKVRDTDDDPGWRERNRRDYFRRKLHDMGLDPDHALLVG